MTASGLTEVAQVVTAKATPDPSSVNSKDSQTFATKLWFFMSHREPWFEHPATEPPSALW
jgi:hypothetical protein